MEASSPSARTATQHATTSPASRPRADSSAAESTGQAIAARPTTGERLAGASGSLSGATTGERLAAQATTGERLAGRGAANDAAVDDSTRPRAVSANEALGQSPAGPGVAAGHSLDDKITKAQDADRAVTQTKNAPLAPQIQDAAVRSLQAEAARRWSDVYGTVAKEQKEVAEAGKTVRDLEPVGGSALRAAQQHLTEAKDKRDDDLRAVFDARTATAPTGRQSTAIDATADRLKRAAPDNAGFAVAVEQSADAQRRVLAARTLDRDFAAFDTAAEGGKPDGIVSREDLEAVSHDKTGNFTADQRAGATYLRGSPELLNAIDTAAEGGSPDGKISREDASSPAAAAAAEKPTQGLNSYSGIDRVVIHETTRGDMSADDVDRWRGSLDSSKERDDIVVNSDAVILQDGTTLLGAEENRRDNEYFGVAGGIGTKSENDARGTNFDIEIDYNAERETFLGVFTRTPVTPANDAQYEAAAQSIADVAVRKNAELVANGELDPTDAGPVITVEPHRYVDRGLPDAHVDPRDFDAATLERYVQQKLAADGAPAGLVKFEGW